MRHRNGDLADRNIRARASAGRAELRRYRRQIPADGPALTLPGHDVAALLHAGAGSGIALSFPAQPAPDLIAVRRGSARWKQSEKRHLVLVKCVAGLSHISSLGFSLLPVYLSGIQRIHATAGSSPIRGQQAKLTCPYRCRKGV